MLHLATCPDIRDEFWNEILSIMRRTGIKYQDTNKFKVLGLLNEPKTACAEGLAILSLAWRCLYAEITKAKIEQTELTYKSSKKNGTYVRSAVAIEQPQGAHRSKV